MTVTQVRVRHVEPSVTADGQRTYLIGVEFLSLQPVLAEHIERWMESGNAGAPLAAEV
jgi:hypothetical protein